MPEAQAAVTPTAPPPTDAPAQPGSFGRGTGGETVQAAADKILSRMSPEPEKRPAGDADDPGPVKRKAKEPSPEPAQQPSEAETEESDLLRELDAAKDEPGKGDAEDPGAEPEARKIPANMDDLATLAGATVDDLMTAVALTVKADGEDEAVNLQDLVSSYQRESDYRLKTAETAEQSKLLAQAAAATQAERQHYQQQLAPFVQQLGQIIQADEASMAELKEVDPYEYNRRRDASEEMKKTLQTAQDEQQRMANLQAQQDHAVKLEDINQNAEALIESVPEWGTNPEQAKKDITEIKDFMVQEYGVPKDAMDNEYRSFVIQAARDAMRYRKLVKNRDKRAKEVRARPKYVKGGVATGPQNLTAQRVKKARIRLAKSGKVRDFAAVLASKMAS